MHRTCSRALPLLLAACLLAPATLLAIVPPQGDEAPRLKGFYSSELEVNPSPLRLGPVEKSQRVAGFLGKYSNDWDVTYDLRSDRPLLIQGQGVPLFAGQGNLLKSKAPRDLEGIAALLDGFLDRQSGLLKTAGLDLRLDANRSGGHGGYFWNVELQQFHDGLPVVGAKVFFRVNHGNVVQFGTSRLSEVRLNARPNLDATEALEQVLIAAGIFERDLSEVVDAGTLEIFPRLLPGEAPAEAYVGKAGDGYGHLLGWRLTFRVRNDPSTYEAVVDAHSGRVVRLVDLNRYAAVQGGVLPTTTADTEVVEPFPFASVTDNGGSHITDASGNYTYGGGTATVSLDGRYVDINDNCGSIAVTGDGSGNVDLGTSPGTDCDTPGFGGAGNTHSARSGFFHLTNINRKAAVFLPGNSWLDGTLTANMNINDTCNAFWDGSTVNFYRSGGGCGNTGEIAAVFLHEWGHGMDDNSGGPAGENGSGEALGDTFAFLETRDHCIGPGFFADGSTCYNCATCTGVRDVRDFGLGGAATLATPASVESNSGIDCDRWSCPYSRFGLGLFPYQGPMGYEGHCESYIASAANWDLTQMLVAEHGAAGWDVMDSIWYGSLQPAQSAYQVVSGGKCNPSAVVDGCGSDNWYTVYLAVDDDNGNLADGTPNGCRIWDAFDAHGIACGARPACSGDPGGDDPPVADFSYSCTDLDCDFTDLSTDDGAITTWSWDFGDTNGSSAQNPSHSYASGDTYTVTLTVTDDGGQMDSTSQNVTVTDPPTGGITLAASGYKVKGVHHIDLTWSGATTGTVDVYRDGALLTTTANDGAFTDNTGNKGGNAGYTHQVCEAGTSTCSNVTTTPF